MLRYGRRGPAGIGFEDVVGGASTDDGCLCWWMASSPLWAGGCRTALHHGAAVKRNLLKSLYRNGSCSEVRDRLRRIP